MKETRRLSRAQFLRLTGAGLAGSALLAAQPYEWAIAQETTPLPIKLGAFVGWDRNYPATDNSTTLSRWSKWATQQGKTPYIFSDWYAINATPDRIRNIDNNDILALYQQVGAKSFALSFNIRPKAGQDMLDIYNGAISPSGYTADEHVVMIGQRLAEFFMRTDFPPEKEQFARVRYLHEFTKPANQWCAFNPDGTERRFTLGHYRQLYRRWQTILAGGLSVSQMDEKLAAITQDTGDPPQPRLAKTLDATRLKQAGYTQFRRTKGVTDGPLYRVGDVRDPVANTNFGTVWCGQSAKKLNADYVSYYPGDPSDPNDPYVYEVGCDIFVGNEWVPIEQKFAGLEDFYQMAEDLNKGFAIPAWNRDDTGSEELPPEDHPEWIDMMAQWMETHPLLSYVCNFEVLEKPPDGTDWRLGNGEEPLALDEWREHVTTTGRYLGS